MLTSKPMHPTCIPLFLSRYSFLDQRGLGALEGLRFATAYGQVGGGLWGRGKGARQAAQTLLAGGTQRLRRRLRRSVHCTLG